MKNSHKKGVKAIMGSNSAADGRTTLIEAKLTSSIVWLPRPFLGQFMAFLADDKALKHVDFSELVSPEELNFTTSLKDQVEIRHFIVRRAFQRCFMKKVAGWPGHPSLLPMQHQPDTRPACSLAPDFCLSFSTSANLALASATHMQKTGVDIEAVRSIDNPIALSTRFFDTEETVLLKSLPKKQQANEFLRFWTIKEASLKAAGMGVAEGLEKFVISKNAGKYSVKPCPEFGHADDWSVETLELPLQCVATLVTHTPS